MHDSKRNQGREEISVIRRRERNELDILENQDYGELERQRERRIRQERSRKRELRRRKRRIRLIKAYSILTIIIIGIILFLVLLIKGIASLFGEEASAEEEVVVEEVAEVVEVTPLIDTLDIDVQLLPINEYSRPGIAVESIDKVVIHYVGNPGTTGQQNHDYYESLIETQDAMISSNYVIGLEGEIIECVPAGEVAYASNSMNSYSVSIEVCHYDVSGEFTEASYESVVLLAAALCQEYGLTEEDVIRHYDVTGKECPIYYVVNEDAWLQMVIDIGDVLEEAGQLF